MIFDNIRHLNFFDKFKIFRLEQEKFLKEKFFAILSLGKEWRG
jgi:hypothetical protein